MKLNPIFNSPVPQTYGEAIMLYPWLKCESHEWDNRTTAENAIWLIKELQAALAEKERELAELREKVRPLLDWVETRTKPNRQHYYSRCVVCNATWWDKKENHNIRCFVPALRAAVEIRNPPGTSK